MTRLLRGALCAATYERDPDPGDEKHPKDQDDGEGHSVSGEGDDHGQHGG